MLSGIHSLPVEKNYNLSGKDSQEPIKRKRKRKTDDLILHRPGDFVSDKTSYEASPSLARVDAFQSIHSPLSDPDQINESPQSSLNPCPEQVLLAEFTQDNQTCQIGVPVVNAVPALRPNQGNSKLSK
jgi:hypothetical protein